jgi:predicted dehydrogenase
MKIKVAQIGVGLIGKKRIEIIQESFKSRIELIGYVDKHVQLNSSIKKLTLQEVKSAKPDLIIVSVPHDEVANISVEIGELNCVVLIEKPIGRNSKECKKILKNLSKCTVIGGFNYRFLPGIDELFNVFRTKKLGNILNVRITLAHGGSPNDRESWKLDPLKCGGGVILDPGIHILDVVNQLLKLSDDQIDYEKLRVQTSRGFWNTGIEESANISFSTKKHVIYNIFTSIVNWENKFEIIATGEEYQFIITGRGGNYGTHSYKLVPRWFWMKDSPDIVVESFPDADSMNFEIDLLTLLINGTDTKSKFVVGEMNFELIKLYERIKTHEL